MGLPATSTIAYNGVIFPSPLTKLRISSRPEMDDAARTIKYVVYSVDLEAVLASGNAGTATTVAQYQQLLQQPAGRLQISNTGFFELDTQLFNADVRFGPHPTLLAWEPLGAHLAARVHWQCDVALSPCVLGELNVTYPGIPGGTAQLAAFNYVVEWELDTSGLSTRSVSGYLEAWLDRVGQSRLTSRTADDYRALINVPVPLGFRRTRQNYRLSPDRRRLDFAIADTEIDSENPLANGAVDMRMRHRLSSSMEKGFTEWDGEISGSIRMRPGVDQSLSWSIFVLAVRGRLKWALDHSESPPGASAASKGVILDGLSFEEDIFGREHSFSVRYRQWTKLETILTASGVWQPIPNASWGTWRASVETMWGPRGRLGMGYAPGQDVIVDLCGGEGNVQGEIVSAPTNANPPAEQPLGFPCPPKERSWLEYEGHVIVRHTRNVLYHHLLKPGAAIDLENRGLLPGDDVQKGLPPLDAQAFNMQVPVALGATIWLYGRAKRIGFDIPRPEIKQVPGTSFEVRHGVGGSFSSRQIGRYGSCKVFEAKWRLPFTLFGAPSDLRVPVPPNHQIGDVISVVPEPTPPPQTEPITQ